MSKITQKKKELKKINQILPKVTYINVVDDSYVDVTDEADPNDKWSADSTSESHSIRGIQIAQRYGDIEYSFDVVPNKTYYLLYYLYGTGSSFGTDTGKIEFVCLYHDKLLAEKSCDALNNHYNRKKNTNRPLTNSITIWNELGQPYVESVTNDYFGGFEGA